MGNAYEDAVANGQIGRGAELMLRATISRVTLIASLCVFGLAGYWNACEHHWPWSAYFGVLVLAACVTHFVLRRGLLRSLTGKNQA